MGIPVKELAHVLDNYLFDGSTIYAALIDNNLQLNIAIVGDASANEFTASANHKLVTGSRIRFAVASGGGNFLPGGLSDTIDYYVIRISSTVFQIATTLANATASTPDPIDFTTNGQGVVFNEQQLSAIDPLTVILNHELPSANGYTQRMEIAMGAATQAANEARKNGQLVYLTASGTPLVYRHVVLIRSGSTTIGDLFGEIAYLDSQTNPVTIPEGEPKGFLYQLYAQPD